MELAEPRVEPTQEAAPSPARCRLWWLFLAVGLLFAVAGVATFWPAGVLVVESSPAGAEVVVDGQLVGQAPVRLEASIWSAEKQIEVRQQGYRSWVGSIRLGLAETRRLEPTLEPLPSNLTLTSSPPGALVTVDGRAAGTTPLTLEDLSAGPHELALTLASFEPWTGTIELHPGLTMAREIELNAIIVPVVAQPPLEPAPETVQAARDQMSPVANSEPGPEPERARAGESDQPGSVLPALIRTEPVFPVAVMVENSPGARPQSGLGAADLVYEAMAEGGVSRFMAVYVTGETPVVGPVRSTRHYFVNLAAELGASLVFAGASPLGYETLRGIGLRHIDLTYAHPGFWRSRARLAPHNAYTSIPGAREALEGRAPAATGGWAGFTFKEESQRYEGPATVGVGLVYEPWGYRVEYRYEPTTNRYARWMEGAPHRDAENGEQIVAASVAVLKLNTWVIDEEGRLDMAQVGSGPASYFVDGVVVEGSWSKAEGGEPTRFLDSASNPMRFNTGPLWVQILSPESKVNYQYGE